VSGYPGANPVYIPDDADDAERARVLLANCQKHAENERRRKQRIQARRQRRFEDTRNRVRFS
jgi:hypothetical protein